MSCVVVLANGVVCGLVATRRKLRTFTNGFVVSLAVSDILSGGVFMPTSVLVPGSRVNNHVSMVVIVSSTLNLSAVAFERYLAVVKPLSYKVVIKNWFRRLVCLVWGVAIFMSVLPAFWDANVESLIHKVYLSCAVILFLVLPLVFILFVYTFIFIKLRQHGKLLHNLHATRTRLAEARRSKRESKTVKIFFSIMALFAFCWIPVMYMTFAVVANRLDLIPPYLMLVSHISILLSSLINPFLYTFMKQDFRREATALFCKKLAQRRRSSKKDMEENSESQVGYTRAPFVTMNDTDSENRV